MAEADRKPRRIRKTESVRQKAERGAVERKPRRIRQVSDSASQNITKARGLASKEYHPIKLPDNRTGRFLTKPRRIIPQFFRESWRELKQVTWPSRKETIRLTSAVLIFAFAFGGIVAATDYGLEKLFRQLLDL